MQTKTIQYHDGDVLLEGYLAIDENKSDRRPAVIVVHDWTGLNDLAKQRAERLAQLGYVGFALDMYGQGKLGKDNTEKGELIAPFMQERKLLRKRILAAYETIKNHDMVDKNRIGAIGFCFGGLCVLDLARSGADLSGVVSFHGLLNPLPANMEASVKAKILALHGYNDPMVAPEQVITFADEMTAAKADWQFHMYGNTMHGFTNPLANDPSFGTLYSPVADQRSWAEMECFFAEIFG